MNDILNKLSNSAMARVESNYYAVERKKETEKNPLSFTKSIKDQNSVAIIGEIKPGSPTRGKIVDRNFDLSELTTAYLAGGVAGFSVLTDPDHFYGSLDNLLKIAELDKPTLMKDFVIDYSQIRAGKECGADAVLFIYRLFGRNVINFSLDEGINYAHDLGLQVLLETNDLYEYKSALKTDADMIGINNRDLRSLKVDLATTKKILAKAGKDRIVWSMSGISNRSDIDFLKEAGADAFLIGTSLAQSDNPQRLLRQLRGTYDG